MRAVVYDRYGPPDVLRLEDVERPVPKDDEVLVRIHATTVNRTDCGLRSAEPFFARLFTGLRRPKRKILGMELAGEVEAVGAAVTEFEVGDHVFGVNGVRRARGVRLRAGERRARAQAGRHELRGGRGRLRRSEPRARLPAKGRPSAGAEHPRLRRLRIHRDGGGAARQALRRRRHRRLQHEERRAREIARSRRGRRLPAGRLHRERQDVRRRLRRGRQALVQAVPTLAEAGRDLHRDRPRVHVARPAPRARDADGSATSG